MKYSFLIFILIAFFYCNKKSKDPLLFAIQVNHKLPLLNNEGNISYLDDPYNVYYFDSIVMRQCIYSFDSIVNGVKVFDEMRYSYFIHHIDSSYGYNFDPFTLDSSGNIQVDRASVDSMNKRFSVETTAFDSLLTVKPDSSYNSKKDFIEMYIHKNSELNPESYTTTFYFNDSMNFIPEKIASKMDKKDGKKLYKVKITIKPAFYKDLNMSFPEREILYEIKKITVDKPDEILDYFEKYLLITKSKIH